MTSQHFTEWTAYAAVEPFGEERQDYRLAYALSVILNMFRGKNDQPIRLVDLLPRVGALANETSAAASECDDAPPMHPNVQRFEEMMEQLEWAQSQI